ncbi:SHOCT domain-containing protein [Lacunisphaera limnophila]|nr:SHOCT domain-containing protein [Lacunisphaera limnophila]
MRTPPLPRFVALILLGLLTPALHAASESKLENLGDGTYAITRRATTGFDRDVTKFRREAEGDVQAYCAQQDKVAKIVSVRTDRPRFGSGFASARIVFKPLTAGDPELAAPATPPPALTGAPAVLPTAPGDYYTELLKLDDLRKRGILSDKEFEAQKKKILKKKD